MAFLHIQPFLLNCIFGNSEPLSGETADETTRFRWTWAPERFVAGQISWDMSPSKFRNVMPVWSGFYSSGLKVRLIWEKSSIGFPTRPTTDMDTPCLSIHHYVDRYHRTHAHLLRTVAVTFHIRRRAGKCCDRIRTSAGSSLSQKLIWTDFGFRH